LFDNKCNLYYNFIYKYLIKVSNMHSLCQTLVPGINSSFNNSSTTSSKQVAVSALEGRVDLSKDPSINPVTAVAQQKAGGAAGPTKALSSEIVEASQEPALLNSLLEKVKGIFTSNIGKKIADFFFSTSINTGLEVGTGKDSISVRAFVGLPGDIVCHLQLDLPPAGLSSAVVEEHPLIQHLVANGTISPDITNLEQLMQILHSLPTQQTSIEWKGKDKQAVLRIQLPDNTKLTASINFPKGFDELTKACAVLIPKTANAIMPSILPLINNEDFRFEWNGNTGQFCLEFAHRQGIKVNTIEIPGNPFISWLCKQITVYLPQKISGTIDFESKKVEFKDSVRLKVEWGPFTKNINFNSVSYDAATNQIALQVTCFGTHTIPIFLDSMAQNDNSDNTPTPRVEFEFIRRPYTYKEYSTSLLKEPIPEALTENFSNFKNLKAVAREKIPAAYRDVFDVVAEQVINGRLAFNLGGVEKFVGADFWLPDGVNCNVKLVLPNERSQLPEAFIIGQEFMEKLKAKLELKPGQGYDVEGVVSLLLTLPRSETNIKWNGTKGEVVIETALPGGARLDITLKIEKIIGRELKELPATVTAILSKLPNGDAIERTLTRLRPFLSTDFEVKWDGKSSRFDFKWPSDLGCQVRMVSTTAESLLKAVTQIDTFIEKNSDRLKPQADGSYDVVSVMQLLATLESPPMKMEWKGTENKAVLTVDLPDGAKMEMEFDIAQLVTKEGLSPALVSILSRMEGGPAIIETLTLLKPFFATNFALELTGDPNNRSLNFTWPSGFGCRVRMVSTPESLLKAIAEVGAFIKNTGPKLKPQANGSYDVTSIMQLLATLESPPVKIEWKGTENKAILAVALSDEVKIEVELDIGQLIREEGLSREVVAILSNMKGGHEMIEALKLLKPFFGTNFTLDLKDQSLSLNLENGLGCKIGLSFPNGVQQLPKAMALNAGLIDLLKKKLALSPKGDYNIDQVMQLLLTLPHLTASMKWKGTKNKATLVVDLPGGAQLKAKLDIEQYLRKGISGLSPALMAILMKTPTGPALMKLLESFAPLLATDFTFKWDGKTSRFDIVFAQPQEVFINSMRIPELEKVASVISKRSALMLPQQIHGVIDFEESSITFLPKLTFVGKVGFISKNLDLEKVKYNAVEDQLGIELACMGHHSIRINLAMLEQKDPNALTKEKPEVDFIVRPQII
jgi:hypothetical protein